VDGNDNVWISNFAMSSPARSRSFAASHRELPAGHEDRRSDFTARRLRGRRSADADGYRHRPGRRRLGDEQLAGRRQLLRQPSRGAFDRCGGQGVVVFYGMAKPVRTPQIGPAHGCSALSPKQSLPVFCVETRHMQAVLKAQINKTDRNDARGMAQMMRVGLYRPVHVKTLRSQKLRMLLTHRQLLLSKAIALENDLRGTLRNFGLKVGMVGKVKFEARIRELVENHCPTWPSSGRTDCSLSGGCYGNRSSSCIAVLLAIVRDDEVCRRLMTTPACRPRGVADLSRHRRHVPARFRKSKSVGAVFGLTCAKYQSGE
jgi:hypothetical protein